MVSGWKNNPSIFAKLPLIQSIITAAIASGAIFLRREKFDSRLIMNLRDILLIMIKSHMKKKFSMITYLHIFVYKTGAT